MKRIYILFIGLVFSVALFSQNEVLSGNTGGEGEFSELSSEFSSESEYSCTKSEADSLYAAKLYKDAAIGYEWLLENKGVSAEVYYNLGNSYYRLNDNARAILNYERALKMEPSDENTKANLEMAYAKTVDKYEDANVMFYVRWFDSVKQMFASDSWAVVSIVFFILFLAAFALFFWSRVVGLKKAGFYSGIVFFFLCIIGNVMAFSQRNDAVARDAAVVMVPSLTAKSTPSESGTALFVIHEGTKVQVTDSSMKDWVEISINSTQKGWVSAETIEII